MADNQIADSHLPLSAICHRPSETKIWSLLPTLSAPMPLQMALDEILFHSDFEFPILRFYFSSEPWTTIGYSQALPGDHVCRRITGGGRVNHGDDVLFSLVARKEDDESFKSVRVSYWKIHEAVKSAMELSGIASRFYRCDENLPKGADCFQFPIASDLSWQNQKIAGGAQKRSAGVMLHQESIRLIEGLTGLGFIAKLQKGFEKVFDVAIALQDLDPKLLAEAETLAEEKYPVSPGGVLYERT